MVCFSWDTELSADDLLDALESTGQEVVSSVLFDVTDPSDGITYHVVAYSLDSVITRSEEHLNRTFLDLLGTVIFPCGN